MEKIKYLFDPLCGWCYAVSPALDKLTQDKPIELVPTGLFAYDREVTPDFAEYAWQNDQRIAALTGLPFSESYRQNILQKPTNFNSFALVQALTAVQQTNPEREFATLRALQKARYEQGKDTADTGVLITLLKEMGLDKAAECMNDPAVIAAAKERIAQGQVLAQQLGVQGVPQVFEETGQGLRQIPTQSLLKQ